MKRVCSALITRFCVYLLLPCLLLSLFGCSPPSSSLLSSVPLEAPPAPTDELLIYVHPRMETMLEQVKPIFERKYPEVRLTYRTFGYYNDPFVQQDYQDTLNTELMAGKGPDLLLFDDQVPNIYKLMDIGLFYNLDNFLLADEEFHREEYDAKRLDMGLYKGQRLYIPLDYGIFFWLTTEEALKAQDVSIPSSCTFEAFTEALEQFISKGLDEPGLFEKDGLHLSRIVQYSGLQFIDFERGEVNVDTEEFAQCMRLCKILYPYRMIPNEDGVFVDTSNSISGEKVLWVFNRRQLFIDSFGSLFTMDYRGLLSKETPQLIYLPNLNGGNPVVTDYTKAAIRSSSPNKANAYRFLKLLLSEEIQSVSLSLWGMPVNKAAFEKTLKSHWNLSKSATGPDLSVELKPLPLETADQFIETMQQAENYRNNSLQAIALVIRHMTPWFEDVQSYEACLAELRSQLEILLYE